MGQPSPWYKVGQSHLEQAQFWEVEMLRARRGLVALSMVLAGLSPLASQTNPYSESLVAQVRALASAVPGEPPTALRFVTYADWRGPAGYALERAPPESVDVTFPVFQIRYQQGWIVIDAGSDRDVAGPEVTYFQERYSQVQQALRLARLILVTHEHHDHVGGVIRSRFLSDVVPKTLLTRAQVRTLLERANVPAIRLDSVGAARYLSVDYDFLLPVAPGVVLIKAPGHTPGSQMVYVRLSSGREFILAGDIAWLMRGIQDPQQKPDSISRSLGEDRSAIQRQLEWLHTVAVASEIVVLPCHDRAWLEVWRQRGVLKQGLDLSAP
jgi:glyoxylase-like metal-dependent hydrolase (beta-lactamase superfamily II)